MFVILILALYFVPIIVACCREHHNVGSIAVINVFLGWTFIGWVLALAMACSRVQPTSRKKPLDHEHGDRWWRAPQSLPNRYIDDYNRPHEATETDTSPSYTDRRREYAETEKPLRNSKGPWGR
jgi:hypothetical protein